MLRGEGGREMYARAEAIFGDGEVEFVDFW